MSDDRTDRSREVPAGDVTAASRDVNGIRRDTRGRDTDGRMLMDNEQRHPSFESTVAAPEPLPGDLDAPEGVESLGQATRDMAAPADRGIDDLPLDAEDVEPEPPD